MGEDSSEYLGEYWAEYVGLQLAEHLGFDIKHNPEEEVMDLRLVLNEPEKDWQREQHNQGEPQGHLRVRGA